MVLSILVDVKMVECCLLHIISTTCGEGILAVLCRFGFGLDSTTTAKLFPQVFVGEVGHLASKLIGFPCVIVSAECDNETTLCILDAR